eukprot:scaffold8047_cov417-Prasinococcus_capsulatus_cf.AAC.4
MDEPFTQLSAVWGDAVLRKSCDKLRKEHVCIDHLALGPTGMHADALYVHRTLHRAPCLALHLPVALAV